MHTFLLRYGEIGLKGLNQRFFLDALVRNVREALADAGPADVRHTFGRILVAVDADRETAVDRLRRVFGVVSLSPVQVVPSELAAITGAAVAMVAEALDARPLVQTFKVDTRRADKRFPLTSMETSRGVGDAIRRQFPQLRADMEDPDLLVQIDIRDATYIATATIPGPGGLPVGSGARALALISGGIDSPVAAWMAARRGLVIAPLHFHSFPFTSERAKDKVVDLCRVLAGYAGPLRLWVVHFTDVQRAIQQAVPEGLRVIVMRRMMMRIAERFAARERARGLVTGESLGQVASQTLESIAAINAATSLPVLRPLIGTDKTEIVAQARAIGTYEISIRPYEDCCALFVPAHPRTHPGLDEVAAAERGLETATLIDEALARSERIEIGRPLTVQALSG